MRNLRNPKKHNRGFTIAEAMIAFAVISIVSIATLTLILTSITATKNANYKLRAQTCAADAIECYRVTDNQDDFKAALAFALGDEATIESLDNITLPDSNYKMNVEIDGTTITVTVTSDSGKRVTTATFTKGGGT